MRVEDNRLPNEALEEIPPEVLAAIEAGRKIEAIKLLRERTGLGLREAKRVVDALAGADDGTPETGMPGIKEVGGGRGLIVIIAAVAIAYLAFRSFAD